MLIDTHAHIDMEDFNSDFDTMLERAKASGVSDIIIPAVEPSTFERVFETAKRAKGLWACAGVHPSEARSFNGGVSDLILDIGSKKEIAAIGEIGLDYYWDKSFSDIQKDVFEEQIKIAKKLNKPVIVHDRDAHKDTFEILKKTKANETGVIMHCFSGSAEFAKECVKEGFYIALGGVVTFKNAKKMKETAKAVPLENLLLETDSPYLAPEPFRGKRNEPSFVKYAAHEIAVLRNTSVEEIEEITTENARRVFRLNEGF